MKSYTQRIKKYSRIIFQVFIFLVSAFLLQLIIPGDPVFKFEYQKGTAWKHEDLVAPFDFAILKTPAEREQEKQDLLRDIAPYFQLDTLVLQEQLTRFSKDLSARLDTFLVPDKEAYTMLISAMDHVFHTGILPLSPENYDVLEGKEEISRITGNTSTKVPVDHLYAEKTAYHFVSEKKQRIENRDPGMLEKMGDMDLSGFIRANLSYDQETTEKQIREAESEISTTQGMVQAGERIILNGEIVDAEKFKILESLKTRYKKKRGEGMNRYMITAGKSLLIVILLSLVFVFLSLYRKDILNHLRRLIFLLFLMVLMVFISLFTNSRDTIHIYLVPMAILPIFIRTFYDSRTAIFILIITTLLVGLYAPNPFEYILIQVIGGVVAVFSLARMHRRVHLVMASLWVLLSYIASYSALNLIQEGSILNINIQMFQWFAGSCLLLNLAYPLIYIFEKLFGFVSDVTLIELSDTNQPLLRKLAEEAPGTFQHSMQIANVAEEIILRIGGNPFLVRAGALYHDIGKIAKASYFTENQFGIQNPHAKMSYEKSAQIVIEHVKNGIKMAKKYKLPESLIEFIATHHGTTAARYFLVKYKNEHPGEEFDIDQYKYPGPLPRTREAAVIMLVDGIEAASRSMNDKNEENMKKMINEMIDAKVNEHQLDNSDLTFHDISTIKEIILNKLMNVYHVRIAYPNEKKKL
jgi:cyclic-di-AMP phosphodiesterase PgpH